MKITNVVDNSKEVLEAMQEAVERALTECGLTAERYAKENLTKNKSVITGNLRNSITYQVDMGEDEQAAYIGSAVEYAVYVECGTGKEYPGGRPTPWAYQDIKGKWHHTAGNRAKPYLKPAVADHANAYRKIFENNGFKTK